MAQRNAGWGVRPDCGISVAEQLFEAVRDLSEALGLRYRRDKKGKEPILAGAVNCRDVSDWMIGALSLKSQRPLAHDCRTFNQSAVNRFAEMFSRPQSADSIHVLLSLSRIRQLDGSISMATGWINCSLFEAKRSFTSVRA